MNKLLIIPTLLALTLFSIYHYKIEGKKIYEQPTVIEKIKQKILTEQSEVFSTKKENNISEVKIFTVETKADVNTTRDYETTLTANVKNANNQDACNFFWYEDEELISMGSTLEHSFTKGEHTITVMAKDGEGHESNATIHLTAWDYEKEETLHFNATYGDLEYKEVNIYDHKGRYIVMDDGIYSNRKYTYDEDDNRIERTTIYYDFPNQSRKWISTYDENHNQLTNKGINLLTGRTLYYNEKTYDEEGNITSSKSGNNEDELHEDYINNSENEDNYYEYSSTHVAHKDNKYIENDAGQIIYTETNYVEMKIIDEYSYDNNGTMTQQVSTMITNDTKYDISIYNYDKEQNVNSSEQIYKTGDEVTCHYKTTSTYTDEGMINTVKQETLDGICTEEVDEDSYKKYSYDEDGAINNVTSSLEKESDESQTTLKVIKSYTNDLEE
jgi:hypothetical protein